MQCFHLARLSGEDPKTYLSACQTVMNVAIVSDIAIVVIFLVNCLEQALEKMLTRGATSVLLVVTW